MRHVLLTLVFSFSFFLTGADDARAQAQFKGIFVGQPASELPNTLQGSVPSTSHTGIHDGDYFRVDVWENVVSSFTVYYEAETVDRTLVNRPVSLAQAIKLHSLANAGSPVFKFALNRSGTVYGLADVGHRIVYDTPNPVSPSAMVVRVIYLKADAPVLNKRGGELSAAQSSALIASARTAAVNPLGSASGAATSTVATEEIRYTYATRASALRAISDQVDVVLGKGRRTLSLITKVSAWFEVDENHPDAKEAIAELRAFYREFVRETGRLYAIRRLNRSKLSESDLTQFDEAEQVEERVRRKMNQLEAMGFDR